MDHHINAVTPNRSSRNNSGQDQSVKPPIHMLNYDCFWKIFSYLEPRDLCLAARSSKYFRFVARNQLKCIKTLDVAKLFSPFNFDNISRRMMDYRIILKNSRNSLTTVVLVGSRVEIPEILFTTLITLLSLYCKNLRHLSFRHVDIITILKNPEIIKEFISIVKLLESLELSECSVTDDFAKLIPLGKNLKQINLSYNYNLSGAFISEMVNLDSLNFEKCQSLNPINIAQILKNNHKSLQYLNVRNCFSLSEENYLDIVKLTELNHLIISGNPNSGSHYLQPKLVAQTPKLKRLEIFECFYSDDDISIIFSDLARVDQLEYLILDGRNTSQAVLKHLKDFTSLKSYKCRVDNIWVEESFQTVDTPTSVQIK